MPLNPTVLSATMRAALLANADAHAVDNDALTALCDVISETVIAHITAAALVTSVVVGTSATGGPVTGTATGAIT